MAPDRLAHQSKEQAFLRDTLQVRDNGHSTWVEWECSASLPKTLESLNDSLLSLKQEGKRIYSNRGLYGKDSLLTVVYRDQRTDLQYFSFNKDGQFPIDLDIVRIPYAGWKAISVEIDSFPLFVRFHLFESKDLITRENQIMDWNKAVVIGVDTLTCYNIPVPISDLIGVTVPQAPSKEAIINHLQPALSIYP